MLCLYVKGILIISILLFFAVKPDSFKFIETSFLGRLIILFFILFCIGQHKYCGLFVVIYIIFLSNYLHTMKVHEPLCGCEKKNDPPLKSYLDDVNDVLYANYDATNTRDLHKPLIEGFQLRHAHPMFGAQGNGAQGNGAQGNGAQGNGAQGNGAQGNGAQGNGAQGNGAQGVFENDTYTTIPKTQTDTTNPFHVFLTYSDYLRTSTVIESFREGIEGENEGEEDVSGATSGEKVDGILSILKDDVTDTSAGSGSGLNASIQSNISSEADLVIDTLEYADVATFNSLTQDTNLCTRKEIKSCGTTINIANARSYIKYGNIDGKASYEHAINALSSCDNESEKIKIHDALMGDSGLSISDETAMCAAFKQVSNPNSMNDGSFGFYILDLLYKKYKNYVTGYMRLKELYNSNNVETVNHYLEIMKEICENDETSLDIDSTVYPKLFGDNLQQLEEISTNMFDELNAYEILLNTALAKFKEFSPTNEKYKDCFYKDTYGNDMIKVTESQKIEGDSQVVIHEEGIKLIIELAITILVPMIDTLASDYLNTGIICKQLIDINTKIMSEAKTYITTYAGLDYNKITQLINKKINEDS